MSDVEMRMLQMLLVGFGGGVVAMAWALATEEYRGTWRFIGKKRLTSC